MSSEVARYRVNEIFYSIQAEGGNAGRPAVFVRFAGCNLKCPFCDTVHAPYVEMDKAQIDIRVAEIDPTGDAIVVFTGGEPTLQLKDDEPLCAGRTRAMETNGLLQAPRWIDHVTVSPKTVLDEESLGRATELKFIHGWFSDRYLADVGAFAQEKDIPCYIQPMADGEGGFDPMPAIRFAKAHPYWRLSLQFHKLIDIQ